MSPAPVPATGLWSAPCWWQQLDVFADDHTGILDDIAPRYLAGPGDARHITHALAAAGWKVRSDPLAPVVDLVSPDLRYRLRHEPQTMAGGAVWRLRSDDPHEHWYAQFTAIPRRSSSASRTS